MVKSEAVYHDCQVSIGFAAKRLFGLNYRTGAVRELTLVAHLTLTLFRIQFGHNCPSEQFGSPPEERYSALNVQC